MTTRILLIRHAPINSGSRLCGSFDVPLSPQGLAELSALVRQRPASAAPRALYTSRLSRARQVAAALAQSWALEPRITPWAHEIHCGDVEGVPIDWLKRERPDLWIRNEAQEDDHFAWPGGESYAAFRARVLRGLATLAANHPGERIALVTHAGVIAQVLGTIRGRPPAVWSRDRPDPLSATEVLWGERAPAAVLTYNERNWY